MGFNNDAEMHLKRGVAYMDNGEYSQAIDEFNMAIELEPNHEWAHYNLGYIYADKKDYDKAIKELTKAVDFNPKNAQACSLRGTTFFKLGNIDRGMKDWKASLESNPNQYKLKEMIEMVNQLQKLGRTDQILQAIKEIY